MKKYLVNFTNTDNKEIETIIEARSQAEAMQNTLYESMFNVEKFNFITEV